MSKDGLGRADPGCNEIVMICQGDTERVLRSCHQRRNISRTSLNVLKLIRQKSKSVLGVQLDMELNGAVDSKKGCKESQFKIKI